VFHPNTVAAMTTKHSRSTSTYHGNLPIFILFAVHCLFVGSSMAWSTEGHQIVGQIADDYLTTKTRQSITPLLNGKTLAAIAPLPDSYRSTSQGSWTAPCHYVDFPDGATAYKSSYCGTYCVVESIYNYTNILTKTPKVCNYTSGAEPCALEFLTHYVGDIHQPLHAGYESDLGGNTVDVYYYTSLTNLHSVWDYNIITQWNSNMASAVTQLEKNITSALIKQIVATMDAADWATESYKYVEGSVYDFTTYKSGDPWLQDPYYNENLPVVQSQLTSAGIRLAQLINNIFDP